MKRKIKKENVTKAKKTTRGRKQCSEKGCRKYRIVGSIFCEKHIKENDGPERVVKLTEIDSLRFGKIDAEMRNSAQGIKLIDYEINRLKIEQQMKIKALEEQRTQLSEMVRSMKPEYEELIDRLAKEYKIKNRDKMVIDPTTGIIREVETK